jgi:hypothetical protein
MLYFQTIDISRCSILNTERDRQLEWVADLSGHWKQRRSGGAASNVIQQPDLADNLTSGIYGHHPYSRRPLFVAQFRHDTYVSKECTNGFQYPIKHLSDTFTEYVSKNGRRYLPLLT